VTTRREFLETSAAILAATAFPAVTVSSARLPIGFSTLGCPKWDWPQIQDFAAGHGYAAVELRGLQDTMDLPQRPEFAPAQLAATKAQLAQHELVISCLGSSANMHEMDATKRAAQLDEGRRFIDLAHALGAPYVRVFGNQYVPGVAKDEMLAHIARGLRELGDYAQGKSVTVLIESHGDFTDSPALQSLLERAASPNVALLWDAHHTFVSGKEEPEETVRRLGSYIRHTHLKDSVATGNDRRYVLTGTGTVPVRRQVEALQKIGYRGFYSFEWEKRWHPEIEEPEVAFAQYATVVSGYLSGR
jgi:sugar phosphate isomerase/epimerase